MVARPAGVVPGATVSQQTPVSAFGLAPWFDPEGGIRAVPFESPPLTRAAFLYQP
jgi:hypothetical protein